MLQKNKNFHHVWPNFSLCEFLPLDVVFWLCYISKKKINNFTRAKIVAVVFRFDPGLSQWFQCSIRSVCNKKKQQTRK